MLMLVSPAKTLDFETMAPTELLSVAEFLPQAQELIEIMRGFDPSSLGALMKVSEKIAILNCERFSEWRKATTLARGKQAVYAFQGDVYLGLDAATLNKTEQKRIQARLRILSGLYGLLKPMDIMMPYRLEMGTRLQNTKGKDLYAFWQKTVTDALNAELQNSQSKCLLNLASNEYFKAVKSKEIASRIISPEFRDWKNGQYKIISFYAKKARGLMARYCIQNNIIDEAGVLTFNVAGYRYDDVSSVPGKPVFLRDES